MNIGMLWFDNSSATLEQKIRKAADYFKKKYDRKPDLCLINPSMYEDPGHAEGTSFESDGLTIRPYRPILPGHIWIGIEEEQETLQGKPV